MKKQFGAATGLCLSFMISTVFAAPQLRSSSDAVPGEIIIQYKEDQGSDDFSIRQSKTVFDLNSALGEGKILNIDSVSPESSLLVKVHLTNEKDTLKALAQLRLNPNIEFAEPNVYYYLFDDGLPNDPDFGKLWSLNNVGQADSGGQVGVKGADIGVLSSWKAGHSGSRDIVVAVIDSGVDLTHRDLIDNLYTNLGESGALANNGKDDDGNGYIDDVHGWNFIGANKNPNDDHGHGSHCAGVIGAVGNNALGISGVNQKVSIMPLKIFTAAGRTTMDAAAAAVRYATKMKVNVMSNSWGGPIPSDILKSAIQKANDAGILFIAAAGNDSKNNDKATQFPANFNFPNVISVAATDNRDHLASFSNYGALSVHVAAPGVRILSTVKNGGYGVMSGTSMACPHIAGVSALVLSVDPTLTPAKLKERLIQTSDPVAGLKGKVLSNGRINASRAIQGI